MTKTFFLQATIITIVSLSCQKRHDVRALPDKEGAVYHYQVFGDSRDGPDTYDQLLNQATFGSSSQAVIHVGDLLSSPDRKEQLPLFVRLTQSYTKDRKFFLAPGNHDVDSPLSLARLTKVFPDLGTRGYHVQTIGGCTCIFLNSEDTTTNATHIGLEQWQWLKDRLREPLPSTSRYRAVFVHRPPFPQSHHKDDPLSAPSSFHELMREHQVKLVVSGHEHNYSHQVLDNVHYVISGGAGSPMHESEGTSRSFHHYIDVFELSSPVLSARVVDRKGVIRDEFLVEL